MNPVYEKILFQHLRSGYNKIIFDEMPYLVVGIKGSDGKTFSAFAVQQLQKDNPNRTYPIFKAEWCNKEINARNYFKYYPTKMTKTDKCYKLNFKGDLVIRKETPEKIKRGESDRHEVYGYGRRGLREILIDY